MPITLPSLLQAVECRLQYDYINKDQLIKWVSDVLEQTGQDKNLAIAYLTDLREHLYYYSNE